MLTNFDPYDYLCKIQDEQAHQRVQQEQLIKHQKELASAYNDLKDRYEYLIDRYQKIRIKHNEMLKRLDDVLPLEPELDVLFEASPTNTKYRKRRT